MFQPGSREAQTGRAFLPLDPASTFDLFSYRVQTDNITTHAEARSQIDELLGLFAFGECYDTRALCDDVMDAIVLVLREASAWLWPRQVVYGYEITRQHSKLRKLLVNSFIHMCFPQCPPRLPQAE